MSPLFICQIYSIKFIFDAIINLSYHSLSGHKSQTQTKIKNVIEPSSSNLYFYTDLNCNSNFRLHPGLTLRPVGCQRGGSIDPGNYPYTATHIYPNHGNHPHAQQNVDPHNHAAANGYRNAHDHPYAASNPNPNSYRHRNAATANQYATTH